MVSGLTMVATASIMVSATWPTAHVQGVWVKHRVLSLQRHSQLSTSGGIAVRRGQIVLSVCTLRRGDTHARESLSPSNRGGQASSPAYRSWSLFRRYAPHPI